MSSPADLPKLAMALEYADLSAALYLGGGSDHAARLLAAAAEQLMSDLARMLGPHAQDDEVQTLLARIAMSYESPLVVPRGHQMARRDQPNLTRLGAAGSEDEARHATVAFLRSVWYTLESMGLEAVVPLRLERAVEHSTIYAPADF